MNTIVRLDLQDDYTLSELWSLQHKAYRLEAEMIGFNEIPPLLETREMLAAVKEVFYGCFDDNSDLLGAVAVLEETPGRLTVTRMMVNPEYFRQGIAGGLLEFIFGQYSAMEQFIVSTGKLNHPAVTLYTKHGFVPAGVEEVAPGVELIEFYRGGKP
ncbi:histone acetyltransferase [Paenibacillus sp. FSL R7-0273]|uniref:GNAT family N-acetyltransferase n=1 Tax=Paenibacillus sp. FSL R7-0273 TaxID=1536772 RepID=UPI0004F6D488|nr:GNAT family N-acetyltransferase [Paenibacillus sp. FSL R7-0273]AIQ49364.1 histone acetyltransferase [Paenibacillus sp. FSL R7-0273]OMF85329.1 histone acetyltransferase [Paenibacillus sp. FSL R7-0273]